MQTDKRPHAGKLASVLRETIRHLEGSQPSFWTRWTPQQVVAVLEREAHALETLGSPLDADGLHLHFLATADIQEIAIDNNWTDAYMALAAEVDRLILAFTSPKP